jgi:hypothetical protein
VAERLRGMGCAQARQVLRWGVRGGGGLHVRGGRGVCPAEHGREFVRCAGVLDLRGILRLRGL